MFDNAGYEVFSDLCLADFLITKGLAQTVRFYVKSMPWFVSDVTMYDFHWLIARLSTNDHDALKSIGMRWSRYLKAKTWVVIDHGFWTLPIEYAHMEAVNPDLYKKLSEAKIVFFKGDLNYRKLFGKRKILATAPVDISLQGFHPTKIASLRTLKCDVVCGLAKGVAENIAVEDMYWNETGSWGVIQCSGQYLSFHF